MNAQLPAPLSAAEITEIVISKGDISRLTAQERNSYYAQVCQSLGLNALTRPLEYLTLQGKMVLYARRDAADQLRKIHNISIEIVSQTHHEGLFSVHVRAKDGNGRADEDLGVVALPDTAKGEMRANLILKAITKAKRRVTLSISGLGFLDETEVEDIPASQRRAVDADVPSPPPAPQISKQVHAASGTPSGPHAIPRDGKGMKAWSDEYLGHIRSATSPAELDVWDEANTPTLDLIDEREPELYKLILGTVEARHRELTPTPAPKKRASRGAPTKTAVPKDEAPPSDGDPEAFLKWIDSTLSEVTDPAGLETIWNDKIAAMMDAMFPPDAEEAMEIYRKHERRLGID